MVLDVTYKYTKPQVEVSRQRNQPVPFTVSLRILGMQHAKMEDFIELLQGISYKLTVAQRQRKIRFFVKAAICTEAGN